MPKERVDIIVNEKGSRVVKRRLAGIGTTATHSAAGVQLLRSALVGIGGALVLTQTVRTLASFEQAMSTVRAVSGATMSEWRELTDVARELGATTRFTATQAAEGMVELARAGFTVDEQLGSVRQTLLLAQAGALDLARASEIAVGTLRGFRLEVDQAERVTDVLAAAANAASTDVNQLGEAMKFVAPVAAGMNVSLEETVAALQALADAQLKGALGGTGLRQVMSELESPSKKTRKILKGLGVEVEEVRITTVGLTAALDRLHKAGVGTGLALQIFGRRGGPAFEVLSNSVPKIKAANEALNEAAGTTKRIAEIMDDNLNGALLRVKSAYEAVQLAFGEQGGSLILVNVLDKVAEALRFLAEHIEIVEGALVALTLIAVPKLIAALVLLSGALSIVALGAAVGALIAFRHEIKLNEDSIVSLGDVASATWDRIKEGTGIMAESLTDAAPDIKGAFDEAFEGVELSLEGILRYTARFLDLWVGFWRGAINALKNLLKGLGPALLDLFTQSLNAIIDVLDAALTRINNAVASLGAKLPGSLGDTFEHAITGSLIPRLKNTAEGAAGEVGASMALGMAEGFEQIDVFEKSLDEILGNAETKAQDRLRKATAVIDTEGGQGPTAPTGGAAPTPQGQSRAFQVSIDLLQEQIDLLRMSAEARQVEIQLRKQEITLSEKGIALTDGQRDQLRVELERLQTIKQVSTAIDGVRGAEIDLAAAQAELNRLVEDGTITLDQATRAYRDLKQQALETQQTISAGWERGLTSIAETISNVGDQMETTLVNAFNGAEDALVSFVTTGKVDFKGLVDSILGDLTRLLSRMLLMKAFEALGGSGGPLGAIGSALMGAGKAGGGHVEPGTVYPVGERGVELFAPDVPGQIIPNKDVKKAAAAEQGGDSGASVTVIVVDSMEKALAAMESAEGKRVIVNTWSEESRERERVG
jgi:TP901 family phage tail tape measure protein/lambda family phage tail tape measure protein